MSTRTPYLFRLTPLSPAHQKLMRQQQIRSNYQLFRLVVWVTLALAVILAILSSPWLRPRGSKLPQMLNLSQWGLGLVSLLFFAYLQLFRRHRVTSNAGYLLFGVGLALVAFTFAVRDFSLYEDDTAFVMGTLALGMGLSAPYWYYPVICLLGVATMSFGAAVLSPALLTPDRIGLLVVLAGIAVLIALVLESRRRESLYQGILLKESHASLKELSFRDGLTGAYNRRFFQEMFEQQVSLANRKGRTFSVVMFDLDRFKSVNDTYGHSTGDEVLKQTVNLVQAMLRASDILHRYGGEEFVLLLLDTPLDTAHLVAERIRERRASTPVDGIPHPVTMSLGVAQHHEGDTPESLIERADKLLYKAKTSGRNRSAI